MEPVQQAPARHHVRFDDESPGIIRSIKQRDLLNTWLRLYDRVQRPPRLEDYQPERLTDELADIVYYTIEHGGDAPRIIIDSDGTRLSNAYGATGKGRELDEYLGKKLAPIIMPIYRECIRRGLPLYTVSKVQDMYGRGVDYERLLMPFSDGSRVTRIVASLKTISEHGSFEIRNLMRANDVLPIYELRAVIARDLFHRPPGRIAANDVVEFE
ncbi:hypothetical protein ACSVBT_11440 [Afipia sp. TerB]